MAATPIFQSHPNGLTRGSIVFPAIPRKLSSMSFCLAALMEAVAPSMACVSAASPDAVKDSNLDCACSSA
jgi:hypothetical protein